VTHARDAIFRHAVASFEPTASGVLLWTRLGDGVVETRWELAADPWVRETVASGTASTGPERDHTVVVDVEGLNPSTSYWYRFHAGGERSPVGRTRTLPGTGAGELRVATVSCANYSVAPLGVYRAVAEREVDLVLHLGDYLYEDAGSGPRRHDPPGTAVTLDDYRRRLAQLRSDPDTQALHLRHPMIAILDDHDLSDNAWRDGAKAHDPARHGPWGHRVAAAARARQEWLPARLRDPDRPEVTWRSLVVGDLAELLLLDTRLVGRDRQAGDDGAPDLHDPGRSLLGEEQRAWLAERLRDVRRPWAVVATGVVMNELELPWPRALQGANRLLPNGYAVLDGRVMHDDQWDGYPAERARVARWMGERGMAGGRTVVLSGDVHSSWAFTGPVDAVTGGPVAVEMTTPAVSSAAMGRAHLPGLWRVLDRAANRLPAVCWADVTERGYGVVSLTPEAVTASWWFVDPYADDPAGRTVPAAAFRSERAPWPPGFHRVEPVADDPERPGLPGALPPRPGDLRRLRRRRLARLTAEGAAFAAVLLAPLLIRRLRRR
jgi:alkaline phosphatase D